MKSLSHSFADSSNLDKAEHHPYGPMPHGLGTLTVTFKNGGVYKYHDVPQSHLNAIKSAASAGSAFHSLIKQGGYRYEKIR